MIYRTRWGSTTMLIVDYYRRSCWMPVASGRIATKLTGQKRHAQRVAVLRRAGARTPDALIEAMGEALAASGKREIRAFVEHCGYQPSVQPL